MKRPELIVAPSSYDPLTARLIEATGFETIHISGSAISRAHAHSDLGLLGLTEMVAIQEEIVEATSLPVVGDCESGFGGPLHAARAVGALERAGLAAIHIEDECFPKSPISNAHAVISIPEMIVKLKACLDKRTDSDFIIVARSNARSCESFDQVMERVSKYAETGVDAIFPGVRAKEEMEQLKRFVRLPMVGVPPRAYVSLEDYGRYGFKIGVIPGILGQAATCAMAELLEIFKKEGSDDAYWKQRPEAQRWRQWFNELGKEEEDAIARLAEAVQKKAVQDK